MTLWTRESIILNFDGMFHIAAAQVEQYHKEKQEYAKAKSVGHIVLPQPRE